MAEGCSSLQPEERGRLGPPHGQPNQALFSPRRWSCHPEPQPKNLGPGWGIARLIKLPQAASNPSLHSAPPLSLSKWRQRKPVDGSEIRGGRLVEYLRRTVLQSAALPANNRASWATGLRQAQAERMKIPRSFPHYLLFAQRSLSSVERLRRQTRGHALSPRHD